MKKPMIAVRDLYTLPALLKLTIVSILGSGIQRSSDELFSHCPLSSELSRSSPFFTHSWLSVQAAPGRVRCTASAAGVAIHPVACTAGVRQISRELGEGFLVLCLRQPVRPSGHGDHLIGKLDPVRFGDRRGPAVLATESRQHQQRRRIRERGGGIFN